MKVKYTGRHSKGVHIPAAGVTVEHGGTVEVSDEIGQSLLGQSDQWQEVKAVKAAKEGDKS